MTNQYRKFTGNVGEVYANYTIIGKAGNDFKARCKCGREHVVTKKRLQDSVWKERKYCKECAAEARYGQKINRVTKEYVTETELSDLGRAFISGHLSR